MNKIRKLISLGPRKAFQIIANKLLFEKWFTFFERFGIHVLPIHFYSPIPDTRELRRKFNRWYREQPFVAVDLNIQQQTTFIKNTLSRYNNELASLPSCATVISQGLGEGYGEVEAHILYSMVRHFKPRTVIEVGSGVSTYFTQSALTANNHDEVDYKGKIRCIEPFPRPNLKSFCAEHGIELIPKIVQDVPSEFFADTLHNSDILFIDSSHILKIDSDVYYLYIHVLPKLNRGVIIHIHDIPFPYPTPNPEHWIFKKHMFWTETAFLHAFLSYNSAFKVLLCSSQLHYKAPDILRAAFPIYDPNQHFPSSIWLQKVL